MIPIWQCCKCKATFELEAHEAADRGSPLHCCNEDGGAYFFCSRIGYRREKEEMMETGIRGIFFKKS